MKPAARITDMHTCPMVTPGVPPIPHVGGPILPAGCPTVLIAFLLPTRFGDRRTGGESIRMGKRPCQCPVRG